MSEVHHSPSFVTHEENVTGYSVPQPYGIRLHFVHWRTEHGHRVPHMDWETERAFRAFFFRKRLTLLVNKNLSDKSEIVYRYRIIRYAVQLPLLVLFGLLTFTDAYRNFSQVFGTFLALMLGATNIVLSVLGHEPDHGPHMLYFFVVYMFLGLRFMYAAVSCWALYIGFLITVRIAVEDQSRFPNSLGYMLAANLALMFATYFTEFWVRLDFARHSLLRFEEERTNELLETLLPERITAKLKALDGNETLIAEEFSDVSILFSDIVGFTSYSASITAREVVNFLNTLYTTFDHLTVVHEVLKVETIGDAYFVASGVLEQRKDHAEILANMAFDMDFILGRFKCKEDFKLQVRIGMHTGRVIAGVVGLKVPRYHLFGDTVTVASMMESTGSPSKIQVSQPMYELLRDNPLYQMEFRQEMNLGGDRGKLKTWWLASPSQNGHARISVHAEQYRNTTLLMASPGSKTLAQNSTTAAGSTTAEAGASTSAGTSTSTSSSEANSHNTTAHTNNTAATSNHSAAVASTGAAAATSGSAASTSSSSSSLASSGSDHGEHHGMAMTITVSAPTAHNTASSSSSAGEAKADSKQDNAPPDTAASANESSVSASATAELTPLIREGTSGTGSEGPPEPA